MALADLLDQGGLVMVILLLLSVYVVSVIFYKIYQFWSMELLKTDFMFNLLHAVEDKKINEAILYFCFLK
jgi:hypothetical protein